MSLGQREPKKIVLAENKRSFSSTRYYPIPHWRQASKLRCSGYHKQTLIAVNLAFISLNYQIICGSQNFELNFHISRNGTAISRIKNVHAAIGLRPLSNLGYLQKLNELLSTDGERSITP